MKKIFLVFLLSNLFIASLSACIFKTILPHYVQVDKVTPLYETKLVPVSVKTCTSTQIRKTVSCPDKPVVLYKKKYISGLNKAELSDNYERHIENIFYDANYGNCFKVINKSKCITTKQYDYKKVIYSYKNTAWSNGKKYEKFSEKPLHYINTRKDMFKY